MAKTMKEVYNDFVKQVAEATVMLDAIDRADRYIPDYELHNVSAKTGLRIDYVRTVRDQVQTMRREREKCG